MILRLIIKENIIRNTTINTKKGASSINENIAIVTTNIELKICLHLCSFSLIYCS